MKKIIISWLCAVFVMTSMMAYAEDVYITEKGSKYHIKTCSAIKAKKVLSIDEQDALKEGYKPCSKCLKEKFKKETNEDKTNKKKKSSKKEGKNPKKTKSKKEKK